MSEQADYCEWLARLFQYEKSEIVENAVQYMNCKFSGIYFLVKDFEIIYVGQSVNVSRRIIEHLKSKNFDSFFAIDCKSTGLNDFEAHYIAKFSPVLNKVMPPSTLLVRLNDYLMFYDFDTALLESVLHSRGDFPAWRDYYRVEQMHDIKLQLRESAPEWLKAAHE